MNPFGLDQTTSRGGNPPATQLFLQNEKNEQNEQNQKIDGWLPLSEANENVNDIELSDADDPDRLRTSNSNAGYSDIEQWTQQPEKPLYQEGHANLRIDVWADVTTSLSGKEGITNASDGDFLRFRETTSPDQGTFETDIIPDAGDEDFVRLREVIPPDPRTCTNEVSSNAGCEGFAPMREAILPGPQPCVAEGYGYAYIGHSDIDTYRTDPRNAGVQVAEGHAYSNNGYWAPSQCESIPAPRRSHEDAYASANVDHGTASRECSLTVGHSDEGHAYEGSDLLGHDQGASSSPREGTEDGTEDLGRSVGVDGSALQRPEAWRISVAPGSAGGVVRDFESPSQCIPNGCNDAEGTTSTVVSANSEAKASSFRCGYCGQSFARAGELK